MEAQAASRTTVSLKNLTHVVEKPKPRKTSSSQKKVGLGPSLSLILPPEPSQSRTGTYSLNDLMLLVENVSKCLMDKFYNDNLYTNIAAMLDQLTTYGHQLETIYKDQLDRAFVVFRNGCQDDVIPFTTKLHLLNIVELRANQWVVADNTQNYYTTKMTSPNVDSTVLPPDMSLLSTSPVPTTPVTLSPPSLGPGEVLKTSGKYKNGPSRVPNKNYCKDEIVIRNADSGKVMGIKGRRVHLIEEISETIISFQRVNPGAKERLVQITGPTEDHVMHATSLIKDTIIRNASPVREGGERERMGGSSSSLNSSASDESGVRVKRPLSGSRRPGLLHSYSTNDASLNEYKYTITLGNDTIKISGTNYETVKNARLLLEENYNSWVQRNTIGDGFLLDDNVFLDSIPPEYSMPRLDSADSGNSNGNGNGHQSTSTGSAESDDITCISAAPGPDPPGFDTGLSYPALYVPVALPQPERRPVLGRSNSIPELSPPLKLPPDEVAIRRYSRETLMEYKTCELARVAPADWEQISTLCPAIVRKVHSLPLLSTPRYYSYDNYMPQPISPYTYSNAWTYVHPYSFPN